MPVSYDLSGQVAVVTGGAKGIGRAVAERLRDAGAAVWVWDIAPAELDGIRFVAVDVTSADQIARAVAQVVDETSRIDILVNNAGYLPSASPFEQLDPESWKRVVAVNLMGMLEASRQALPYLRRADKGRIVNLGSLAGKEGLRNLSVYSAASAGVIAFTKALGRELADTPIRVNCVAPGPIDTDLIRDLGLGTVDAMIAASPMKRLGTVGEAAELILWLCSDACSFSTGAVFDLSGAGPRIRARIERFQATWTRFAVENWRIVVRWPISRTSLATFFPAQAAERPCAPALPLGGASHAASADPIRRSQPPSACALAAGLRRPPAAP